MFRSKRSIAAVVSKQLILLFLIVLLIGIIQPCQAGTFVDNFDDGNADGWVFPFNDDLSQGPGIWTIENGTLVQSFFGDGNSGLVDNLLISDQVIEVTTKSAGYTGVVLWYQQVNEDLANYVYVGHDWVSEVIDGQLYGYRSGSPWIDTQTWYDLRVVVDSTTGNLAVYVDGVFRFTYQASTPYRTGLSGVCSSNHFGYFDNFRLTSNDIPIPVTINIKPQGDANRINLRKNERVAVAILSTPEFDAPSQVDQGSLTFGATGDEQSLISCKRKPKDVNHDGVKDDLVCNFSVQLAGFQCGDTEGILKGLTIDGKLIEGKDLVNIVQCK